MKLFGKSYYKSDGLKLNLWKFFDSLISPFVVFFESVQRLVVWFPVIWKDRDWDYHYLYEVLKKKIELMSKYEKKHAWATKADEVSKQMDEAIYLIDKVDDDCIEEALEPFYEVYPNFESEMVFSDSVDNPKFKTIGFKYDSEEQEKLYNECLSKADEIRENYKNKLFGLLKDKIDWWWD